MTHDRRPVPDELLDLAVERVKAGETMNAVCADLGISRYTLSRRRQDQLPASRRANGGRATAALTPRGTGFRESIAPSRKAGKYHDYSKGRPE